MNWFWLLIIQIAAFAVFSFIFIKLQKRAARKTMRHNPVSCGSKQCATKDCQREQEELALMRSRSLRPPLSETVRPIAMDEIIGQNEGVRALRAALCGPSPQHILIYGPPGIGKTCAARLVLDEAKQNPESPFCEDSPFIEMDATCVRFDERAIADPLIGSVHDPIYQGAGALGMAGIPQPKPGAVSRAHCGVLFLDEIGELHPMQMNKLLKVLEDRRVCFESSYYSPADGTIPAYIHDIFKNGMPADFRLIGATTRKPEELPAALRSRCMELYFKPLSRSSILQIAKNAASKLNCRFVDGAEELVALYSSSGREAVNIVQLAHGIAYTENRNDIYREDVEWVAKTCRHKKYNSGSMDFPPVAGVCTGLGVTGEGTGAIIAIECSVTPCEKGCGDCEILGAVSEELIDAGGRRLKRRGTAPASAENALYNAERLFGIRSSEYRVRFNIPGGAPMDGPSAGLAMLVAYISAALELPLPNKVAITGELSLHGRVLAVGGVREKIEAAIEAGAKTVLIPSANMCAEYHNYSVKILPIDNAKQAVTAVFGDIMAMRSQTERSMQNSLTTI